jgi:hypothetical protein
MARLRPLSLLFGAGLAACSPEVVIAHRPATDEGGSAGSGGTGGSGGGGGTAGGGAVAGIDTGGASDADERRLLADSVADFSLEQGKLGWQYGYDLGSLDGFALMTRISTIVAYAPATKDVWDCWGNEETHWTQVFQLGAHPNGTDTSPPSPSLLQRAVRRWLSDYAGAVVIRGEMAKIDVALEPSNGVDASVYVDGTLLFTQYVGGQDGGGLSYEVKAMLHVGSTVDFVLDPHDGDDHHDLTRFTGIVARDDTAQAE